MDFRASSFPLFVDVKVSFPLFVDVEVELFSSSDEDEDDKRMRDECEIEGDSCEDSEVSRKESCSSENAADLDGDLDGDLDEDLDGDLGTRTHLSTFRHQYARKKYSV